MKLKNESNINIEMDPIQKKKYTTLILIQAKWMVDNHYAIHPDTWNWNKDAFCHHTGRKTSIHYNVVERLFTPQEVTELEERLIEERIPTMSIT